MASAARSRLPLAAGALAVVGGGLWWQTAGGQQQPRSRAEGDPSQKADVSGTLQQMAGTGGPAARAQGDMAHDPKDTRVMSGAPNVHSKKDAEKHRTGTKSQAEILGKPDEGGGNNTQGGGSGRSSSSAAGGSSNTNTSVGSGSGDTVKSDKKSSGRGWFGGGGGKDNSSDREHEVKKQNSVPQSQKERETRSAFYQSGAKTGTPVEQQNKENPPTPQGKGFAEPGKPKTP